MLSADFRRRLANLEGLISAEVGERLAELASQVPHDRAIVEIGSYKGKSTAYLAAGSRAGHGAPVFAVDPWDTPGNVGGRFGFNQRSVRQAFRDQVVGMGLYVAELQGFSVNVAKTFPSHCSRAVGLLYIDGSHTAKDVQADWDAWSKHLSPPAVVAFDDYRTKNNPGVAQVVDRLTSLGVLSLLQNAIEEPEPLVVRSWVG